MTDRPTTTRRGALALLGTTALAGCSGLPIDGLAGGPTTIEGAELRSIADGTAPTIPESVPVDVEPAALEARAERARELLSTVPTPLGEEEIPNGAIREELASMREHATEALDAASNAATAYEAMDSLRHARGRAGALAAAWAAIDAGRTREDLLGEAEAIRGDVRAFANRWRYVGGDPVRAVLATHPIEVGVDRATRSASVDREALAADHENPVTVGELGGDLELARALRDDVSYLYDRYTNSLADATEIRSELASAAASLVVATEERRAGLPAFDPDDPSASVGRDIEDTTASWALRELHDEVTYPLDEDPRERPASVTLQAQSRLVRLRAFASLHERIAGEERIAVESAADVASLRSAAVRAIERARVDAGHPGLVDHALRPAVGMIRRADRDLTDARDDVEVPWIARDVGFYVIAAAVAGAVPAASDEVATALGDAV